MADSFWSAVAPAALGWRGAFAACSNACCGRRAAFLAAAGGGAGDPPRTLAAAFSCLLLVLQRPFFAASALLAGMLFLVLVSNAKYHALREPFIFQDFEYFSDAFKHPRLYLPFSAPAGRLLALLAFGWRGLCGAWRSSESAAVRLPVADFLTGAGGWRWPGCCCCGWGRGETGGQLRRGGDLRRLGLLAPCGAMARKNCCLPADFAL
ncbi:MAG: hypothetical protein V5B30_14155 [Candidatus Accumulibacter delftensis]